MDLDFVFYLSNDWSMHHRPVERYTELARQLQSTDTQVLCVDRSVCPFTTPIRNRAKWRQWRASQDHARPLADNLFLYTPYVLLHDLLALRVPGLPALNHRVLAKQVRGVLAKKGFRASERVAWVTDPRMVNYYGVAQETVQVYECIDHVQAEVNGQRAKLEIARLEERVCRQADVVFCTARGLYEEKKAFNPNTHFVPNAADTGLLTKTQDPQTPIAASLRDLPHPIVGYLGTINEHTDIALLKQAAEARPEWTFVMIGPELSKDASSSTLLAEYRALPNVRFTGWVEREELPNYCKAFDVCVIPYRTDSDFNRYVNPEKMHEYIAMGKPVVATDIPEVRSHQHIIQIAQSSAQFVPCIERALAEDSPARIQERLRVAQENSWAARARQHSAIIERALTARRASSRRTL